jgi:hypothetical protein
MFMVECIYAANRGNKRKEESVVKINVKPKAKAKGNTRVPGAVSDVRIPFTMTAEESAAFDEARARKYPLAKKSDVLRDLIAKFVKEAGAK